MRRRQTHRNQQVGALVFLGNDGFVRNKIRPAGTHLNVAFVAHMAFRRNVALAVVRIHVVRTHAHRVGANNLAAAVFFSMHIVAHHAASFANVGRMGPVVGVGEFVFSQPPAANLLTNFLRRTGMIGHRPQQAANVGFVGLQNFGPRGVIGIGIIVIAADKIGRYGIVVV